MDASWDITLGLVLIAFVLPFVFVRMQMAEMRSRARTDHVEKEQLRRIVQELEVHVQKDKSRFLEALGVPFLLLRPSGRLVMANRVGGQLLGIDETRNVNLMRVLGDTPLRGIIGRALKATAQQNETLRLQQADGEHCYHTIAIPFGTDDRYVGIVFHDITEEDRTMVIRRDFVANASHELRTPLTIIRGYVETLLDDPESAADKAMRDRALKLIRKHVDRIVRLVEDMLALSRLEDEEGGRLKLDDFDLAQLAEDVRLRLKGMSNKQQAQVTVDFDPAPFILHGDRFYWSQILFNLVENALKNNPAPGVRIRLRGRHTEGGGTCVEVEDDGVGIAADALPYIFNRFFRADPTGKVKGTGLGLAIVRHAGEAHGGTIAAESEPGVRTLFRIELPAPPAPDAGGSRGCA